MPNDAELVAAYLGGSRDALGAIYDRHADALHDTATAMLRDRDEAADVTHDVFLLAAERLGQLRDPTKLKAWLFAILRNEVFRHSRQRRRARPTDFTEPERDMAAPSDPRAEAAAINLTDLADELRQAARGLDERDQLVLELTARQGLSGEELATALGVSVPQSYVVVTRMRDRVQRSLGALVVARAGRRDCPELDTILRGWDGTLTVLLRKRVARHIESCATCERTRSRLGVLSLVAAAPAVATPVGLRERVLSSVGSGGTGPSRSPWDRDGFPPSPSAPRRALAAVAAAAAAVVLIAAGLLVFRGTGDDLHPSAGSLGTAAALTPTTAADLVADSQVTTSLVGTSQPVAVTAGTSPPPPTTALSTTAAVGDPTDPTPPSTAAPGPAVTGAFVIASATTAPDEEEPPRVEITSAPAAISCPWSAAPMIGASVADASAIASVALSWSGPGDSGSATMNEGTSNTWSGRLDVERVDGTWSYLVTAIDAHGNEGTASGTLAVADC